MKKMVNKHGDSNTEYVPLLKCKFLSDYYDFILYISGLGRSFKKGITNSVFFEDGLNKTIVDVGSGTGTHLKVLSELYSNTNIIGIEPDYNTIQLAHNKFDTLVNNVSMYNYGAESIPLSKDSVDLCFSTLTFHHLSTEGKKAALKEIYRILKLNGLFVLTDWGQTKFSIFRHFMFFENKDYMKDHFDGLIPKYVVEAGFVISSMKKVKISGIYTWVCKK